MLLEARLAKMELTPKQIEKIIGMMPQILGKVDLTALINGESFLTDSLVKSALFDYFEIVYDEISSIISERPIHREIKDNKSLKVAFARTMSRYNRDEKVNLRRLTEDTLAEYGFIHGVPSYNRKYASRRMTLEF